MLTDISRQSIVRFPNQHFNRFGDQTEIDFRSKRSFQKIRFPQRRPSQIEEFLVYVTSGRLLGVPAHPLSNDRIWYKLEIHEFLIRRQHQILHRQ